MQHSLHTRDLYVDFLLAWKNRWRNLAIAEAVAIAVLAGTMIMLLRDRIPQAPPTPQTFQNQK